MTNIVPAEEIGQNSYELNHPLLVEPSEEQQSEQLVTTRSSSALQPVATWSPVPQWLSRRGWLEAAELVIDVLVTFLPLLFLTFAIIAANFDGKSRYSSLANALGDKVSLAATLGPTVFPIVFAFIVRCMLREGAR
jgi:hypothetical protein